MFTRHVVTSVTQFSSPVRFTLRNLCRRIALVLLFALVAPTWSATLTVTTNADSGVGSLRDQIAAAATNDTLVFAAALDGATISLTTFVNDLSAGSTQFGPSAFFITGSKALTIDATTNGLTKGVVITRSSVAGTAAFRLFDVGSGSSLTLRGLTLSNGLAEGGHGRFGGSAMGAGGAIFNQGTLILQQCTLTGNVALGGTRDNSASFGGSGVGQPSQNVGGGGDGGGPNGGAKGINGTSFPSGNGTAGSDGGFGGGGGSGGNASIAVSSATGGNGGTGGFGGGGGFGGYHGNGGTGGFGGSGGGKGGFFAPDPATLEGTPGFGAGITVNLAGGGGGMGGAIFNDAGIVSLTNVTLAANAANGGGNITIFSGNGSGYGGALFNYAGSLTLDSVTASGNSVAAGTGGAGGSADGGAIYSLGDSAAACSAGGNTCNTSGNATLVMNRSIAANSVGGASDVVISAIHSGTSNGSGTYNAIGATTGFVASNAASGSVLLGSLPAALGGGLVDVMLPQAGSVAINTAGPAPCSQATDQRRVPRPQGPACDIGAVESYTPVALNAAFSPASVAVGSNSTFTFTATNPNAIALTNVQFNNTVPVGLALVSQTGGTCGTFATGGGVFAINPPAGTFSLTANSLAAGTSCTISVLVRPKSSGSLVDTSSTATSNEAPAGTAATATLTAAAAASTMTLSALPTSTVYGQSTTLTATITTTNPTPGGTVAFSESAIALPGCGAVPVSSSAAQCSISSLSAGLHSIIAVYSGDSNTQTSTSATLSLPVGQAAQTITFSSTAPTSPTVGGATYTVSATGGASGNPVTFSIDGASAAGACTIAGAVVSFTGGGTCIVDANQAGNINYSAAPQGQQTITVTKLNQAAFTATATPSSIAFNATSALSTTGGSGTGAVSYAVTAGPTFCLIAGSTLTGTGAGTCTVTATKAADANYNATTATVNVTVNMINQAALTAIATPASIVFNATSALSTAGGSGTGAVSYAVTAGPTFCSIAGSTLTGTGVGTCTVTATKVADANYNATTATVNVTVGKANQAALTAVATPASIVFNATSVLSTTGGSGTGAVSYSVTAGPTFCSIAGSTLTGSDVGTCTVTATKAADANYNATTGTVNVTVSKAATTTTLGPVANIALGQSVNVMATVAVTAPGSGTPSGTIIVSDGGVGAGDGCTITLPATSCSLTPTAAGNQTLTASYSGNANFTASSASGNLAVGTSPTAITFTSSPNPSRVGQPVLLTATVAVLPPASSVNSAGVKRAGDSVKAAAVPTGTVTFSDGATVLGTVPLNASDVATLTTLTLAQGSHTLTARYSGDASAAVATITAIQLVEAALPVPGLPVWMLVLLGLMLAGIARANGARSNRRSF